MEIYNTSVHNFRTKQIILKPKSKIKKKPISISSRGGTLPTRASHIKLAAKKKCSNSDKSWARAIYLALYFFSTCSGSYQKKEQKKSWNCEYSANTKKGKNARGSWSERRRVALWRWFGDNCELKFNFMASPILPLPRHKSEMIHLYVRWAWVCDMYVREPFVNGAVLVSEGCLNFK